MPQLRPVTTGGTTNITELHRKSHKCSWDVTEDQAPAPSCNELLDPQITEMVS